MEDFAIEKPSFCYFPRNPYSQNFANNALIMQSLIFKDFFKQNNRREIFRSGLNREIVIEEDSAH